MRRLATLLVLALALTAALTACATATATATAARTTFNDVERDVMCVSCGVPLAIAESPQADRERAEIRRLIAQGLTKQQVQDELVSIYGRRVLANPPDSGFGLAAYLVPIALVLAALALVAVLLPRWRRARTSATRVAAATNGHATAPLSPDDARRLEEDLARYEV
jgi:cytochrome c-type biogenesis protein CcmH